jgi:hypothetical protein
MMPGLASVGDLLSNWTPTLFVGLYGSEDTASKDQVFGLGYPEKAGQPLG